MAPKSSLGVSRQPIPLSVIRSDMANGCIPPSYLQTLIPKGTKPANPDVTELRECPHPDAVRQLSNAIYAKNTPTLVVTDRAVFDCLATEALMCNIGSVGMIDPGQIANSYIASVARGQTNEIVNEYLSTLDILFLDSFAAPVVTGYLQSRPDAAHYFFSFTKTTKYMTDTIFVLDVSALYRSPEKGRPQIADAIAQVYGYDTANLLLENAITI